MVKHLRWAGSAFAILLSAAGIFGGAHLAYADPGLSPSTVEATVLPGGSITVAKTVTTPTIPPNPDIVFLADTTGSMGGSISNVQTNIGSIMATVIASQPTAQFAAVDYKDGDPLFCTSDPYAVFLGQNLTATTSAVQTAVNAWSASGGCDTPESQIYALNQIATGLVTFRTGSSKIVVWFGDAPGHDPALGVSMATAIANLNLAGVRVIAIDVGALNSTLQAVAISSATGGSYLVAASAADVSAAILSGLTNLPAVVAMQSNCTATTGGAITTTFSPASVTVPSGTAASFAETITVSSTAPAGSTFTCLDWATINGVNLTDAAGNLIVETKTIHVPSGPDLSITKEAKPGQPAPTLGGQYAFIIKVKNIGNRPTPPATDVMLSDDLSGVGSFAFWVANAGKCSFSPPFVNCRRGAMAPGEVWTVEISVRLPRTCGVWVNRAVVDPWNVITETNEANNSVALTVPPPAACAP